MYGMCLAVQCVVLTTAMVSARFPPELGIFPSLDISQITPRYEPEEGGFTSTLRMLGNWGSKIFDKALQKFNTWSMHSTHEPGQAHVIPTHAKNFPSDLNVADSMNFEGVVPYGKPHDIGINQAWWEEPFCAECFEGSDFLQYLPTEYGGVRALYDSDSHVLPQKPIRKPVSNSRQVKRNKIRRPSTNTAYKLVKTYREVWNPIESGSVAVGYEYRPSKRPVDKLKHSSSNLWTVIHRPTFKTSDISVEKPTRLNPLTALKVIHPPIQITTSEPKTTKPSGHSVSQYLWKELDVKRNKESRKASKYIGSGYFINPTTSVPVTTSNNSQ